VNDDTVVAREECPKCGSRDNLARYADGHAHCFSMGCGHHEPPSGEAPQQNRSRMSKGDLLTGDPQDLPRRKLKQATCEKFGYWIGTDRSGETVQIANYRPKGVTVAQKIRTADKRFVILGDGKQMGLFGQHLWRDGGKRVVITEGEIDAMSVAQAFGLSWPVVSVPTGAAGAEKAIKENLEWLEGYEQVVLMFDMDEPGRAAAEACAAIFSPGKVAIAQLPLKDPNEMLKAGRIKELTGAIWEAKTYRPDGIVNGADTWEAMVKVQEVGWKYPPCMAALNDFLQGQSGGSLITWTSGTGMGKSTAVAEVAYELAINQGHNLGYVALEENTGRSAKRFVGLHMDRPIHIPEVFKATPQPAIRKAFDETLGLGKVWFYDHFGSMGEDSLMSKLRYLIKGCGCRVIVLDHLSIVVSASEDPDERRLIDRTMTNLRSLVEETGVLMHLVSHLRRAEGTSTEEGGRVHLGLLRGSHSIAQLSDTVVALERNQQAPEGANIATIRVLKDRLTGNTGVAGRLEYNKETGRMSAAEGFHDETDGAVPTDGDDPPF
jgi:twinkle protein